MTKRYDFRFPPEVGEALDMVGHRNRTGWTAAAIMGTMAMARAAEAVIDAAGEHDSRVSRGLYSLADGFGDMYRGHLPLTCLVDFETGRHRLALLAQFRELDPLTRDEVSAVLVMAWVRNVDPKLFSRMAGDG